MIDEAIKPCPNGHTIKDLENFIYPTTRDKRIYAASCDHPNCCWSVLGDSPEHALERWNTRNTVKEGEWVSVEDTPKKSGYISLEVKILKHDRLIQTYKKIVIPAFISRDGKITKYGARANEAIPVRYKFLPLPPKE